MKDGLEYLLRGLAVIGILGFASCDKGNDFNYKPNMVYEKAVKKVVMDFNQDQRVSLGDKLVIFYDMNNDGIVDMQSNHWIREYKFPSLNIDYWKMPHEVFVDLDGNGQPDLKYSGFNDKGYAQKQEKLTQLSGLRMAKSENEENVDSDM
jgi:hypothetical protein